MTSGRQISLMWQKTAGFAAEGFQSAPGFYLLVAAAAVRVHVILTEAGGIKPAEVCAHTVHQDHNRLTVTVIQHKDALVTWD